MHVDAIATERAGVSPTQRNLQVSVVTLVVGAIVVAFLTAYNLQPCPVWAMGRECSIGRTWEEYLVVNLTGLALLPAFAIFALPREGPHLFGVWRPRSEAWLFAAGMYALMLIPLALASRNPSFMAYYPMQPQAAYSWGYLIYFELAYGLYMLSWEFFYRGFLTFGLARRFGTTPAVILQALAFGIMHYGKPYPEFIGSFLAGIALGWLAVRARSFYPCFALHWACSVTFDLLVIYARPDGLF